MPGGADRKNGLAYAVGTSLMYAAWPIYARRRHGNAKHIQLSCTALLLKAPKSANMASTPVNASKIPPRFFQPSVLLRTR